MAQNRKAAVSFNPRTRDWVRTRIYILAHVQEVSIHAPVIGCESLVETSPIDWTSFNPRTRDWVRIILSANSFKVSVSIHAPVIGCELKAQKKLKITLVSIHAPVIGCEFMQRFDYMAIWFQSTHP